MPSQQLCDGRVVQTALFRRSLSRVIQSTTGLGYTFFRTAAATELVGLCKQYSLDAVYLGLYNRQQVGFRVRFRVRVGVRLFLYRRRHCRRQGDGSGLNPKPNLYLLQFTHNSYCLPITTIYHTSYNLPITSTVYP